MRQRLVLLALAASALLTACDAPNLAGPNDPSGLSLRLSVVKSHTDEHDQPWVFEELNPCNGDLITGAGLIDYRLDEAYDSNGASTVKADNHGNGVGSGDPSGKVFKADLHQTYEAKTSAFPNPAYSIKEIDIWTVTGPKPADNYKRTQTVWIIVDSHGVTTKNVDSSVFTCGK